MSGCICSSGHLPYHESDHVLNLTYNALLDGVRLEDIELRRNDEAFLDSLGAQRIPDPTTAGDFTRRFDARAAHWIAGQVEARGIVPGQPIGTLLPNGAVAVWTSYGVTLAGGHGMIIRTGRLG